MNQAYFTFCCSGTGMSVSGMGGDCARAAVKGTSEQELSVYKKFCSYPQYINYPGAEESLDSSLFVSLDPFAKLVFSSVGTTPCRYFLAHSVYALPDKQTHREGNYFSHLIYPLPESWSVRIALEMWGSPFWVTQDSETISPELPPIMDEKIRFGIINEKSFVEFLRSSSERQKKFLFVLNSLMSLKPNNKIVLTGLPEDMAFCLWGATRCLPSSMWKNVTFSTHEKPTLSFSYVAVNFPVTEKMNSQDEIIFQDLVQRQDILLYSDNPRILSSKFPPNYFAEDILNNCLNGKYSALTEFYKSIPPYAKESGTMLNLFWMFLYRQECITLQDIELAIKVPVLKAAAINILMDNSHFTLDEQLKNFPLLDAQKQEDVLNRLISEKSIQQIRDNALYSKLLISALSVPEEPKDPEKDRSLLHRLFR